jgi:hypothetical protein
LLEEMHREGRTELPQREFHPLFIGDLGGAIPHCLGEFIVAPTEACRDVISVRRQRQLQPRKEWREEVGANIFEKKALALARLEVLEGITLFIRKLPEAWEADRPPVDKNFRRAGVRPAFAIARDPHGL